MSLMWDWETRGIVDLTKRGVYVYSEHPATVALLASFKLKCSEHWDDMSRPEQMWADCGGPLNTICRWKRGEPCPPYVRAYIEAGGEIKAFNAAFERLIFWNVMTRIGWPRPKLEQFRCTAVTAAAMSLPRSLKFLGLALDLKIKKDKRGDALIKIHSIPKSFTPEGEPIWHPLADNVASLAAFHDYCDVDVLSEEEADERLIPLSDTEMEIYWLNERINDRGIRIDTVSARAALRLIDAAKQQINDECRALTGASFTEVARLKRWCESRGVELPSLAKEDVEEFLHDYDDLPDDVRRALELRQEGAKPSVDKTAAMLQRCSDDDRCHGVYIAHGAGQTGRFSSRGTQMHNLPKYRKEFEDAKIRPDLLFKAIRTEDPATLKLVYGPVLGRPLHLLSDAVRGFIFAAPSKSIMAADYSAIEGRMAAWFAREEWKLEAFRALDRGEGHGIYELAAAGIYGITPESVSRILHRPVGKLAELSCIAEGQLVLTDAGLIPIEKVPLYSRVWDGVEWVSHKGPVFRGYKEVITYQGLTATADHIVFTKTGREIPFGAAACEQDIIAQTGFGRQEIRLGGNHQSDSRLERFNQRPSRLSDAISANVLPMLRVRGRKVYQPRQPAKRHHKRLFELHQTTSTPTLVGSSNYRCKTTMRKSERSWLSALRWPRNRISIQICNRMWVVDNEQPDFGTWQRDRSKRQHGSLRARKYSICHTKTEPREQTHHRDGSDWWRHDAVYARLSHVPIHVPENPLRRPYAFSSTRQKDVTGRNCGAIPPTVVQTKRAVWDILEAGPRHRFTVSGRLVHNCQYQTGVGGIRKFARQNKIKLATLFPHLWRAANEERRERAAKRFEERTKQHDPNVALGREGWIAAELIKIGWRSRHPKIVEIWKLLEEAAIEAVETGNVTQVASVRYRTAHGFLWCQLPSGRCLAYGSPKMQQVEVPWADKTLPALERERKLSLTVRGVDPQSEKWVRFPVYGGSLFNNVVQGSARDILTHGMLNAERAGYEIMLHTHDEMACEIDPNDADLKAFEALACDLPAWTTDLPLTASGYVRKRYKKD